MALIGPFSKGFAVNFKSGGDTTKDAFHKHIQEIDRIYGYLNALDAGKVSADDVNKGIGDLNTALTKHINSTSPHPNWKPSFSYKDLTDKPSLEDLSGTLSASKVSGKLTNATIDAGNVNGLSGVIDGRLPASSGDGITASSLADNGYVKFKNGLIIQWGRKSLSRANYSENPNSVTFPMAFTEKCYMVTAGTEAVVDDSKTNEVDTMIQIKSITKTGFKFMAQEFYKGSYQGWDYIYCNYIAIGK